MDILKLAILAFIAAGIVLAMSGVSTVQAVIISGSVTAIFMIIAVIRGRRASKPDKDEDDIPNGPTIK